MATKIIEELGTEWIGKEFLVRKWANFHKAIEKAAVGSRDWIYRGQPQSKFELRSSFDRNFPQNTNKPLAAKQRKHLENFKLAVRGRQELSLPNSKTDSDSDWWAIGQHYGLETPLLDWSYSPYVAAFFGFASNGEDDEFVSVYALNERLINRKNYVRYRKQARNRSVKTAKRIPGRKSLTAPVRAKPIRSLVKRRDDPLTIFEPKTAANNRMLAQRGLFTLAPPGYELESWITKHFPTNSKEVIARFLIPRSEESMALKNLMDMNINHISLYPDIHGSCNHCNAILKNPSIIA